jgi:hypothetical protein
MAGCVGWAGVLFWAVWVEIDCVGLSRLDGETGLARRLTGWVGWAVLCWNGLGCLEWAGLSWLG